MLRWSLLGSALALGLGCGPRVENGQGTADATDGGTAGPTTTGRTTTSSSTSITTTTTTSSSTTTSTSSSSSSGDDVSTTLDFTGPLDVPPQECDVYEQDCGDGEKCTHWSSNGSTWVGTQCVPVHPDPDPVGETCTVEGYPYSGVDTCDETSMCWDADPQTLTGYCVPFCVGSRTQPQCTDACDVCTESTIALCFAGCNPLQPQCPEGRACYPVDDGFVCLPDDSNGAGEAGDPCASLNECMPGTFCANDMYVPGCRGNQGCCASFCDLSALDPCPGAPPGVECVPWYEQPPTNACLDANLGACVLPG